jgi:hypothetical protein
LHRPVVTAPLDEGDLGADTSDERDSIEVADEAGADDRAVSAPRCSS